MNAQVLGNDYRKIVCKRGKPVEIKVSCPAFERFLRFLADLDLDAENYQAQRIRDLGRADSLPEDINPEEYTTEPSVEELLSIVEACVNAPSPRTLEEVTTARRMQEYRDVPLQTLLMYDVPAKIRYHLKNPVTSYVVSHEQYIRSTPLGRDYLSFSYLWDMFGLYEQYWTNYTLWERVTGGLAPSDAVIPAEKIQGWLSQIIPRMEQYDVMDLSNQFRTERRCTGYHYYHYFRENGSNTCPGPAEALKFLNDNSHLVKDVAEAPERFDAAASILFQELVKETVSAYRADPGALVLGSAELDTTCISYWDARALLGGYVVLFRGSYLFVPHLYQVIEYLLRAHPLRKSLIDICCPEA